VEEELSETNFNDVRLAKRLMLMVDKLIDRPEASVPQAMASWAGTKAAYRFLDSQKVTPREIRASHLQATVNRATPESRVLILQDTTVLDFTAHPSTSGLGYLEKAYQQGLLMHSALCCTTEGVPLGILGQEVWVRDPLEWGKKHKRYQRPLTAKESAKWIRALTASVSVLPDSVATVTVADREADIFELFSTPRPVQADLLIRACQARLIKADNEVTHLWDFMQASPVKGQTVVKLEATKTRKARTARCNLHYEPISLLPPQRSRGKAALPLWAVLVREAEAPQEVEPLEWLLLTTLQVESLEEALQCVRWYSLRWLIERYHLVLKSGCRVEKLQLETAERIEKAVAVYSIVAWKLLWLTYEVRICPEASCETALERYEWEALYGTIHHTNTPPREPPTLQQAVRWIAQLGGFLGRKSDGEPGVMVIWRGLRRLEDIAATWKLLRPSKDVGNG
jgi:hypothetical protein